MFPKIIHQIWFDFGDASLSDEHKELINITKKKALEYGYEYILWEYDVACIFVKKNYSHFLSFFSQKAKYEIMKCDFFRYLIMYHFGGVYLDLDFFLLQPPHMLIDDDSFKLYKIKDDTIETDKNNVNVILFEEWYNSANLSNKTSNRGSLHNGFLCSYPKQNMWYGMCVSIYMNLNNVKTKDDVWITSGTNKLRNTSIKYENDNIHYCKYYVVCPFKCKRKSEIMHCTSENDTPFRLNESSWSFFSFSYIKENIEQFRNSIAVCVFLKAGSLWTNNNHST